MIINYRGSTNHRADYVPIESREGTQLTNAIGNVLVGRAPVSLNFSLQTRAIVSHAIIQQGSWIMREQQILR